MRILRLSLEEGLAAALDKAARRLGVTRSAFARETLRAALGHLNTKEMERAQREGYLRKPVRRGEFSDWEAEQVWPD